MKNWMLKGGSCVIVTAGLLLAVFSKWDISALQNVPETIPATKRINQLQIGAPARDAAHPPQPRAEQSRNTDVSMATRLRPQGTVTVGGHVRSPGPVSFTGPITLEQAIQRAGGATEIGSLHLVSIIRDGECTVYDVTKDDVGSLALHANDFVEVSRFAVGR